MFKSRIWRSRVFRKHVAFLTSLIENPTDDCVKWPYYTLKSGYGKTIKWIGAHRLACYLAHGEPPAEGLVAAHSCGKGHLGCVNPKHLRWATQKENMADKLLHGTQVHGERSHNARLTNAQAAEIKREFMANPLLSRSALAKEYHVGVALVSNVLHGRAYKYVLPVVPVADLDKHKGAEYTLIGTGGTNRVKTYEPWPVPVVRPNPRSRPAPKPNPRPVPFE